VTHLKISNFSVEHFLNSELEKPGISKYA